jgi:hypothetical protein
MILLEIYSIDIQYYTFLCVIAISYLFRKRSPIFMGIWVLFKMFMIFTLGVLLINYMGSGIKKWWNSL